MKRFLIGLTLLPALASSPAIAQVTETQPTTTVVQKVDEKSLEGIVSEINAGAGTLKLTTDESSIPMTFHFSESTPVVDIRDAPFTLGNLKLGKTVTVHYLPGASDLMATRIVVGDAPEIVPIKEEAVVGKPLEPQQPAVIEKKTTTTEE